jgi:hypothetical protein
MTRRVIIANAVHHDDGFAWDRIKAIQAEMFGDGDIALKLAFYGSEGGQPRRPCRISSQWISDPVVMASHFKKARANCVCGCFVDVGDVLTAALKEQEPVDAIVIFADAFHGDFTKVMANANKLGVPLFIFHQTQFADRTKEAFRTLAKQTGGAYFAFNPLIERLVERLPRLFKAVAQFAIGGTEAVKALDRQSPLLEQMRVVPELKERERVLVGDEDDR